MPDESMRLLKAKPDEGSLELTEDLIRLRAYYFYEKRGREHGHDRRPERGGAQPCVGKRSRFSGPALSRW